MGKMAFGNQDAGIRGCGGFLQGKGEFRDLLSGKGQKETLQKDYGFPETGIDVVVRGVEDAPFTLGLEGGGVLEI